MTPKDQSDKLYHKFYNTLLPSVRERNRIAIEHSLIAVDEILEVMPIKKISDAELYDYWQQVKNELLKQQNNG